MIPRGAPVWSSFNAEPKTARCHREVDVCSLSINQLEQLSFTNTHPGTKSDLHGRRMIVKQKVCTLSFQVPYSLNPSGGEHNELQEYLSSCIRLEETGRTRGPSAAS